MLEMQRALATYNSDGVLIWNKGTPIQEKSIRLMRDDVRTLKKKMRRLTDKFIDTQEAVVDATLERFVYNKSELTSVDFTLKRTMNAGQRKQWREGSAAWRKMVDDGFYTTRLAGTVDDIKAVPAKSRRSISVVEDHADGNGRAWSDYTENSKEYQVFQGEGRVGRDARASVVHELSHTLEFSDPVLMAESIKFRNVLTQGDELKTLKKLFKDKAYTKAEVVYETSELPTYATKLYNSIEDDLGNVLVQKNIKSPGYSKSVTSRVWSDRDGWNTATEIVTVGVQEMYKNPAVLAREYPKLFDFIYERVVKRKYTNKTSKWALELNKDVKFVMNPVGDVQNLRLVKDF
jgi:hypothetical protein